MSNNQIYFVSGKVVVKSGIFFEKSCGLSLLY